MEINDDPSHSAARRGTALASSAFAAITPCSNVSYDPTRELYADFNKAFVAAYQKETGKSVRDQAVAWRLGIAGARVIDGLQADIVTLALAYDIDAIAARASLRRTGRGACRSMRRLTLRLSCSCVRKGNPKAIKDWDDLIKPGVQVITPNPKTSAARAGITWRRGLCGKEIRLRRQGEAIRRRSLQERAGARHRRARLDGDLRRARRRRCAAGVENEAFLAQREFGKDKFEIVAPPLSILAEPPVASSTRLPIKKARARSRRPT